MSAPEVVYGSCRGYYSLINTMLSVINFANPDMVGHTGVIPAAVKAVEKVDELCWKSGTGC